MDKEEEEFIVTWIESNRDPNGPINWGEIINDILQRFDKLRSKNKIKNFWYSRLRRRQGGQVRDYITNSLREFDSINNTLQSTITSRFNPTNLISRNQTTNFPLIHSSNPNISYTNYSIPQPNSVHYPLQSNSIPITPHFTQIPQHHTIPNIHQPIPTIYWHNSTVLQTLQPKPDPPQFNKPHTMKPI